jgi:hypothetical protein
MALSSYRDATGWVQPYKWYFRAPFHQQVDKFKGLQSVQTSFKVMWEDSDVFSEVWQPENISFHILVHAIHALHYTRLYGKLNLSYFTTGKFTHSSKSSTSNRSCTGSPRGASTAAAGVVLIAPIIPKQVILCNLQSSTLVVYSLTLDIELRQNK